MSDTSKTRESELKFLVTSNAWKQSTFDSALYRQGYLCRAEERTVRVRLEGEVGKLTVKGKKVGATAPEFDYEIPKGHAEEMLDTLCLPFIVEKRRSKVKHEGFIWEIDEFLGLNEGLVIAEVELEHEKQVPTLPAWVGQEVTKDSRYSNARLSEKPFRQW